MLPAVAVIGLQLIVLHRPDGAEIVIAPAQIVSLQVTSVNWGKPNTLVFGTARCVVELTSNRRAPVAETCNDVRRLIEEAGGK
jgi:hypothetical protein